MSSEDRGEREEILLGHGSGGKLTSRRIERRAGRIEAGLAADRGARHDVPFGEARPRICRLDESDGTTEGT